MAIYNPEEVTKYCKIKQLELIDDITGRIQECMTKKSITDANNCIFNVIKYLEERARIIHS